MPHRWYYLQVFGDAWARSRAFLKGHLLEEGGLAVLIFIVALVIGGEGTLWEHVQQALFAPLIAIAVMLALVLFWNLAWAPVLRHRELILRIERMQPKGEIVLGHKLDSDYAWAHVLVTNKGPTNDVVATIVDAQGMPVTTPCSIKWRGWSGESRPIASNASQLLDLAEVHYSVGDDRATNEVTLSFYYVLYGTTAKFNSPLVEVRRRRSDQKIEAWREVPLVKSEAEFARCFSLLVEASALNPHYSSRAWVHLGFDADGQPVVDLEAVLSTPDSEIPP